MKWAVVAVLGIALLAYAALALVLLIPFGIAEPGSPSGFGPAALVWGLGEMAWTLWTFARRTHAGVTPGVRIQGLSIVVLALVVAWVAGLRLSDRRAYNGAAWTAALIVTVACRLGRFRLPVAQRGAR